MYKPLCQTKRGRTTSKPGRSHLSVIPSLSVGTSQEPVRTSGYYDDGTDDYSDSNYVPVRDIATEVSRDYGIEVDSTDPYNAVFVGSQQDDDDAEPITIRISSKGDVVWIECDEDSDVEDRMEFTDRYEAHRWFVHIFDQYGQ